MTPRAITGIGIASALGIGREAFLRGMAEPPATFPKPESFDASAYANARIAEVPGFDPSKYLGDKGLRTLDRLTKLLVVAARLALHDGGIKKDGAFVALAPEAVGIVCSNAYGSLEAITELDRVAVLEDARYINPAKFPNTVSNSAAGYASIWEELRAVNVSVSDGNCGALDAVACADVLLDQGRAEALLVGGAEAMSEALFLAFHKLGATDGGTPLGEAAVLFVLESRRRARERGQKVLAEVVGYGTSFEAPEEEGSLIHASKAAMERAIRTALEDAAVSPADIDLVASGIADIEPFRGAELEGIDLVFGAKVPIAAPKALFGETLGAGGGMGMAAALAWMHGAPTRPLVRGEVRSPAQSVLVTSMGYYGNASAVVMRRP